MCFPLQVIDTLITNGGDLNAKTSDGHVITDLLGFWKCPLGVHKTLLHNHRIQIPDFTNFTDKLAGTVYFPGRYLFDWVLYYFPVYLQAGCWCLLVVEMVAALAVARDDIDMYYLAYYSSPQQLRGIDMDWVMTSHRDKTESLQDDVRRVIERIYDSQSEYGVEESNIIGEDSTASHAYYCHQEAKVNPTSLKYTCVSSIRRIILWANGGCSIILTIKDLNIPQVLKQLLTFDRFCVPPENAQQAVTHLMMGLLI